MNRKKDSYRIRKRTSSRAVRRFAEIVLFAAGIALICYPMLDRYVQEKKQTALLTEWDASRAAVIQASKVGLADKTPDPVVDSEERTDGQAEQSLKAEEPLVLDGEMVIGAITIEKIDLREPMLARTTKKTLDLGVGSVVPDVFPGELGNFVLAGHRRRAYGKQFNRLDELEEGDRIVLETPEHEYVYEVVTKFVVEPNELHVLDQDISQRELTLITCEPIRKSTHRLIVKAKLLQTTPPERTGEVKPL